jgi:hypothetical protein
MGKWIRLAIRAAIENTDQEPVLVDSEPGAAGSEIFPGKNLGFRRPQSGRRGRAVIVFVAVCRYNHRTVFNHAKVKR